MVDENPKGRERRKSLAREMAEALGFSELAKLFKMLRAAVKEALAFPAQQKEVIRAMQEAVILAMHANRPQDTAKQEAYSTELAAIIDRHQEALKNIYQWDTEI